MPVTIKFQMLTWCTISQIIQVVSREPEITRRLERSKDTHVTISAKPETFLITAQRHWYMEIKLKKPRRYLPTHGHEHRRENSIQCLRCSREHLRVEILKG